MTTPTVHHPLSTIPPFNTIQHTPTQQLSLRVTPPSNVIQCMIGRPLPHTPRTWNHPTRWSVVVRGWGIAMMSSVQEVLVTQAMKEDHMIKLQRRTMYWTTLISDYEYDTIQILIYIDNYISYVYFKSDYIYRNVG